MPVEPFDISQFPKIELPRFLKIKQNFNAQKIEDIPGEVRAKMAPHMENLEGKRIAIGVGSRGIANIAAITKTVVERLKEAGALPFIIPVMGSHGGATPEGQAEMLEGFGITAETMGCPLDASMDVESIGEVEPGFTISVAKSALEADGYIIIPRIKPHTNFRGPIESGVLKMLCIGLGKQAGTEAIHTKGFHRFHEVIPQVGVYIAQHTNLLFSLSIVENAYDETYKIEALSKEDVIAMDKEKALLEESRGLMASLPFQEFDALVIEEVGKNISGDGQDPNITGLYIGKHMQEFPKPRFQTSVVFDVTEESHGNALGVGMVDITTWKLYEKANFNFMYMNTWTNTVVAPIKLPMVLKTPEDALRTAVKFCNNVNPLEHKIVWIKNTLELSEVIISEPLMAAAKELPHVEILTEPTELVFVDGEPQTELIGKGQFQA
jgi:hypothetical protein